MEWSTHEGLLLSDQCALVVDTSDAGEAELLCVITANGTAIPCDIVPTGKPLAPSTCCQLEISGGSETSGGEAIKLYRSESCTRLLVEAVQFAAVGVMTYSIKIGLRKLK